MLRPESTWETDRLVAKPLVCSDAGILFEQYATDLAVAKYMTWRPHRVSYQMRWLGEKLTLGAYGTDPESYGDFSDSPETAPVLVPGHDRPLQFQHWMSGRLRRDGYNDFKVFLGNAGLGPGAFSCVDDKFLPPGDYVVGTLLYKDQAGAQQALRFNMKHRC